MPDDSDRFDEDAPTVRRRIRGPVLTVAGERERSGTRRRLAAGTTLVPLGSKEDYRVVIHYREPTYESRHGRRAKPYRWTFRVQARSNEDAVELAVAEFHAIELESSVSWTRDIVGVFVERETAADES